jgi:hypothetical protein
VFLFCSSISSIPVSLLISHNDGTLQWFVSEWVSAFSSDFVGIFRLSESEVRMYHPSVSNGNGNGKGNKNGIGRVNSGDNPASSPALSKAASRTTLIVIAATAILFGTFSYINVYWTLNRCGYQRGVFGDIDEDQFTIEWLSHRWRRILEQETRVSNLNKPLVDFKDKSSVDPYRPVLSVSLTEKSFGQFNPWGKGTEINIWDLYPPQVSCPDVVRLGKAGDGGKWICGTNYIRRFKDKRINRNCLIYSFGVSTDISFETELQQISGCDIHAFDPTVGKLPNDRSWPPSRATNRLPGITLHKLALSNESGSNAVFSLAMSLQDIMHSLNHSYIDVLKIDVEGAEWDVFNHLFRDIGKNYKPQTHLLGSFKKRSGPEDKNSKSIEYMRNRRLVPFNDNANSIGKGKLPRWTLPFGQLLIELHYSTVAEADRFFTNMYRAGFLSFSREINLAPTVYGNPASACEYSFINPNIYFLKGADQRPAHLQQPPPPQTPEFHQPIRAVIYILSQRKRIKQLQEALELLYENFWLDYGRNYPVVIFEDDIGPPDQRALQHAVPQMKLRFIKIHFRIPSNLNPKIIPNRTVCDPAHSTLGYRHMCRFHATLVHDLLAEHGYGNVEYILRLDDDSRIVNPIGYDLFRYMKVNQKLYGFVRTVNDNIDCVTGLWDLADRFLNRTSHQLGINRTEVFFDKWPENLVIFNNFEVSHVSVWQNPVWKAFMAEVDESGGIYMLRWGDAPLHTIGISMILKVEQVHSFSDVGYYHFMLNQTSQGLARPNTDPFATVVCVYYDRWICSPTNGTNATNAKFALAAPEWNNDAAKTGQANLGAVRQHFFSRIGGLVPHSGADASDQESLMEMGLLDLVKATQRGVLFTFTMRGRERELAATLTSFYDNFLKDYRYPVTVFYSLSVQPSFDRALVLELVGKQISGAGIVTFVGIETQLYYPKQQWPNVSAYACMPVDAEMYAVTKFLTFEAIKRLAYMGYEWFFRFDESSKLARPLLYDVFETLASEGRRFGFLNTIQDKTPCWYQAIETVNTLCYGHPEGASHKTPAKATYSCADSLDNWPKHTAILSGFTVSHISVWKTPICEKIRSLVENSDDPLNHVGAQVWPISFVHTYCVLAGTSSNQVKRFEYRYYSVSWFTGKAVNDPAAAVSKSIARLSADIISDDMSKHSVSSVTEIDAQFMPRRFGWLAGDCGYSFALPTISEVMNLVILPASARIAAEATELNSTNSDSNNVKDSPEQLASTRVFNKFKKYVWLFDDSMVGTSTPTQRLEAVQIANTVGIAVMEHTKHDTSSIKNLQFYWGQTMEGAPKPIFQTFNKVASNYLFHDPRAQYGFRQRPNLVFPNPPQFWSISGIAIASIKHHRIQIHVPAAQAPSSSFSSSSSFASSLLSLVTSSSTNKPTSTAQAVKTTTAATSINTEINIHAVVMGYLMRSVSAVTASLLQSDVALSFQLVSTALFVVSNPHDSPSMWEYSERSIIPVPPSGQYFWYDVWTCYLLY